MHDIEIKVDITCFDTLALVLFLCLFYHQKTSIVQTQWFSIVSLLLVDLNGDWCCA